VHGVYIDSTRGSRTRFRRVKAPTSDELTQLTHAIARRINSNAALYLYSNLEPTQLLVRSPKGGNKPTALPHETSLFDVRLTLPKEEAIVETEDYLGQV